MTSDPPKDEKTYEKSDENPWTKDAKSAFAT